MDAVEPARPRGRAISVVEHALILWLLCCMDDAIAADILYRQTLGLEVEGGPLTMIDFFPPPPGSPRAEIPDGPLPGSAVVESASGEILGTMMLWVTDGCLSGLEYAWVTDDAPSSLPTPWLLRKLSASA